MPETEPFTTSAGGVRVRLRLQPGASRSGLEGPQLLADGRLALKAWVGAPPEGGKANAALIKLLAKSWRLPKGSISIIAGQSDRLKTLEITGDPRILLPRLEAWLETQLEADTGGKSVTALRRAQGTNSH